jgi:hypothetical protein
MTRSDLICPLDGLVLGLPSAVIKQDTDLAKDAAVGGHVHLPIDVTLFCANGHRWRAKGDIILERTG